MNRSIKLAGLVAGVSLAAVVAGALVAAQQTPTLAAASDGGNAQPIDTVTSAKPPAPIQQTLDLTKLKQGSAPATAYVAGRTVHSGRTQFDLPASDGLIWDVVHAGAGDALVHHSPQDDGKGALTIWAAGARGETIKDVNTVASSADRTSSAYAVQPTTADGAELSRFTLNWRDNGTGEVYSLDRTGEHGPIVHAVQGSEVYFSALSKSSKQTLYSWTAGDDTAKRISAVPAPSAVSTDLQLAASVVSVANDGSCTALVELGTAKKRWQTCTHAVDELPAKSTFALGGPAYRDGYGDGLFAALDLKTGKAVREWSGGSKVAIMSTTVEGPDHILALAEQNGQTAIARCEPKTGACELAVPLRNGTGDGNNRPYQLGR
ncbi:hypothetical protein HPO96_09025 [Kribbella sandramycini]|uniref:Pyrroloquinoline-quinone binding quinoprotein n=1 Tax=Kribbella sandramycini TaxID=60450 RepID=A0A7Y4NYD1_9ACTN|nr:hypothetical protein [Kribbella sandramycini]MBB6569787.1 hypothetical protein [Kribbella sandramycini]NOL40386.1 hypothetical protein [Kribbella sandramycini]